MHSQSSFTNQSFPYLPLTNVEHTDSRHQLNTARSVHANSLGDLKASMEHNDLLPIISTARPVSTAATQYGRPPSPRVIQRQMSFSEDDISFANSTGIGWNVPHHSKLADPLLRIEPRAKISSLKALRNIPLSLKAFKSSIPIQSQSATLNPIPVDERIVRSIQMQAQTKSRSLKHIFNKSHTLNPFEHRPLASDKLRKNSLGNGQKTLYTGRNASDIIRRKQNQEHLHFGHSERIERDKKSCSLDLSLLSENVDEIQNQIDPHNDVDGLPAKFDGSRRFSRRLSGRRTRAKQFSRDNRRIDENSEKVVELINAFSEEDLYVQSRSHSLECGRDEVFESPKRKASLPAEPKAMSITGKSSNTSQANEQNVKNEPNESPNRSKNSAVQPVAHDSSRNPNIANRALNSSPKNSKPQTVLNESQPNNVPSNNSEYDVRDRSGATAHSSRAAGKILFMADLKIIIIGQSQHLMDFPFCFAGHRLSGQHSLASTHRDHVEREPRRSLSDRDARDQDDSFNRSLSNAEGTPDDKIGKYHRTQQKKVRLKIIVCILLLLKMDA